MTKQTITHVGPAGQSNDEEKAQNDFAAMLIEAARQKEAEKEKQGGKK